MTARRPIERDDIFRERWVGDPAIDPMGERIAFVVSLLDPVADRLSHEVHVIDPDGSVRRLGPAGADERAPSWSPDGRRLALISDRDGHTAAWIVDPSDDSAHPVARAAGAATSLAWSPDGSRLAVTVVRPAGPPPTDLPFTAESTRTFADGIGPVAGPDRREAWILDADADSATCLTPEGEGSDWDPTWSPDGGSIACLSDRGVDPETTSVTGLWVMAPDGSNRRRLVEPAGPIRVARWSPDGTEIAYLGHRHGDAQGENVELWLVAADGTRPAEDRCSSRELDRSVGQAVRGEDERGFGRTDLAWTPDGRRILAIVADGGTSDLRWFDRDGGSGTLVGGAGTLAGGRGSAAPDGADRCVLQFATAADSGDLVMPISDPSTPGELWRTNADGSAERRVTGINDAWLAELDLAPTSRIEASSHDGPRVDGWLTGAPAPTPADPATPHATPRPLVLQVHGGPHYPIGARFSLEAQSLAAQGYLVLTANPRGSQGYGVEFATTMRGQWGGPDFDDLMALVDRVVDLGLADPTRLAIMGESYGGYMTAWAIGQTDRFAAAIAENGINDLRTIASQGGGPPFWHSEMDGTPWTEPERYAVQSPLTHVERMTTPLLLVHAELDGNCPIAQSEVLHAALRALGRDVTFVRIPGEGHLVNLFGRPSRRRARQSIIDAFLADHLGR